MKSLKDFLEARMIATGDFKISASGRKVRRLIKVGDDSYNKADDLDKDGDVDKDDRRLAKEEVEQIEEATVKSASYSWGTMKTVHHGKDFSIPLHPEHHKPIAALKHGESHSFKDETGNKWKATRDNDTVHFHGGSYGTQKTSVKHDAMKESVEITEAEEHLVHVSDGSKYDEVPHPKDIEHVKTGAMHHGGKWDGHSDKGAFFKFKSKEDAQHFVSHVNKCPHRSCSADLHESTEQVNEASDKQDSRLLQLARLGLLDKNDVAIFRNAMQTFKADKQLSIKQRNMLLSVYNDLVNMVTGDDAMFARAKLDVQKEDTDLEEGKVYDPFTKKMVPTKPIKVQAGGGATRNGVPIETGPSKYKEKLNKEEVQIDELSKGLVARYANKVAKTTQANYDKSKDKFQFSSGRQDGMKNAVKRLTKEEVQIDEISKDTLASYIPKAAKDARIHGQIATDFENRGKTARKPGSKDSWNRLSMKYKEKAWKRDDGISKAVNKLTKEETQSEGYYKDIDTNAKEDERLGSWKKETPWRKIKPGSDTVTDKSGATHTPMSKVRHLARLALKKTTSK